MDFDWVKARAQCSLGVIFRKLKAAAARDVDSINAIFAETKTASVVELSELSDRFLVIKQGRSAEFKLTASSISINVDEGRRELAAVPALNPEGDCRLLVNGNELELWQVCRLALEEIFFAL
jgi:hypothetical protein